MRKFRSRKIMAGGPSTWARESFASKPRPLPSPLGRLWDTAARSVNAQFAWSRSLPHEPGRSYAALTGLVFDHRDQCLDRLAEFARGLEAFSRIPIDGF